MVEKIGGSQDDKERNKGRGGMRMTAMAAGLIAAGAANAQNAPAGHQDYGADTYEEYGSSYEEFSASPDALKTIDELSKASDVEMSISGTISQPQITKAVQAFIETHPAHEGKTIESPDRTSGSSEPSYAPLADLQAAVYQRVSTVKPLLIGLLMQELDKEGKKAFPTEKNQ